MKLNNRGYSLAEMIVAMGIGVILSGIATFSFIEAMNMFSRTMRQYSAEADMIGAMYTLKANFNHATKMVFGGDAGVANNTYSLLAEPDSTLISTGVLFKYNGTQPSGISLIAMGLKDLNATTATTNVFSNLYAFGVYYQRYETNLSGALYFDVEKNTNGAGQWSKLSPRNASTAYGRFTQFFVENIHIVNTNGGITLNPGAVDIGRPIVSAEFRLAMRYHTRGNIQDWKWCPRAIISGTPACISNTNYFDIEKKLKVVFVNNEISVANGYAKRPYGNLYFFHSAIPGSKR